MCYRRSLSLSLCIHTQQHQQTTNTTTDKNDGNKKICQQDTSKHCNNDKDCGDKAPCISPKTEQKVCNGDRNIECDVDKDCGKKAPCISPTKQSKERKKVCKGDSTLNCKIHKDCGDKAPCISLERKVCKGDIKIECELDKDCGEYAPCISLNQKICKADPTVSCETDKDCGDKAPCISAQRKICKGDPKIICVTDKDCDDKAPCISPDRKVCEGDSTMECDEDKDCGEKAPCVFASNLNRFVRALNRAIDAAKSPSSNAERLAAAAVVEKHDLLRRYKSKDAIRGPAFEACKLLGEKCHVDMKDALTSKDMEVLTALRVLQTGEATAACLGFGETKCRMSLDEVCPIFSLSLSLSLFHFNSLNITHTKKHQARNGNHSKVVEAILRLQKSANSTKEADRRQELNRNRIQRDLATKLRHIVSSSVLPEKKEEQKDITEKKKDEYKGTNQIMKKEEKTSTNPIEQVEQMLREQDGPYGSMSATEPNELAVCNAPGQQNPHCYCAVLGEERCRESLFAAYLSGDSQVLSSIRELLGSNATGSAVDLCRALGPHKCRESIADAVRRALFFFVL